MGEPARPDLDRSGDARYRAEHLYAQGREGKRRAVQCGVRDVRGGERPDEEEVMIIERQDDVTKAVLQELERAPNARFREIMGAFVRHMHDFVREAAITEEEFRTA